MFNRDKILEQFPLASVQNDYYYALSVSVPLSSRSDLIDLLDDYNIPIEASNFNSKRFYVTIPKYDYKV